MAQWLGVECAVGGGRRSGPAGLGVSGSRGVLWETYLYGLPQRGRRQEATQGKNNQDNSCLTLVHPSFNQCKGLLTSLLKLQSGANIKHLVWDVAIPSMLPIIIWSVCYAVLSFMSSSIHSVARMFGDTRDSVRIPHQLWKWLRQDFSLVWLAETLLPLEGYDSNQWQSVRDDTIECLINNCWRCTTDVLQNQFGRLVFLLVRHQQNVPVPSTKSIKHARLLN